MNITDSSLSDYDSSTGKRTWSGTITLTSHSQMDENNQYLTKSVKITTDVIESTEKYIEQKITRMTNRADEIKDKQITSIKLAEDKFKEQLGYYSLVELNNLKKEFEACRDIAVDGFTDESVDVQYNNSELKDKYVNFYSGRIVDIQDEIKTRESQIEAVNAVYNTEKSTGEIQDIVNSVKTELDLENYLGEELYTLWYSYRREDDYSNDTGTLNVGNSQANGKISINGKVSIRDYANNGWLGINDTRVWVNGVYFGSSTIRTDGIFQLGDAGNKVLFNASSAKFSIPVTINNSLAANNITATNVTVNDTLKAFKYELNTIQDLGGEFCVAPTIYIQSGAKVQVNKDSATTIVVSIQDTNAIKSDTIQGVRWAEKSKIKFQGKINGLSIRCNGVMKSKLNTVQNTMSLILTVDSNIANSFSTSVANATSYSDTLALGIGDGLTQLAINNWKNNNPLEELTIDNHGIKIITKNSATGIFEQVFSLNMGGTIDCSYLYRNGNLIGETFYGNSTTAKAIKSGAWSNTNSSVTLLPGVYMMTGTILFAASKGGRLGARFATLDSGFDQTTNVIPGTSATATGYVQCQWIMSVTEGTKYYLQAWQSSGANVNVTASYMKAVRIA